VAKQLDRRLADSAVAAGSPVAAGARTQRWPGWLAQLWAQRGPYLFLLPAMALLSLTYLYPVLRIVWDGLFRHSGGSAVYVGLTNYQVLLDTPDVRTAFQNNLKLLGAIPIILLLSVIVAYIFNENIRGRWLYQTLIFLPTVISVVVVGVLFMYILRPSGLLNEILTSIGLDFLALNWLGDVRVAIYAIMGTIVWKELGFGIMLFRARLASLDPEYFDAARVDGANELQLLWHVVVPQLIGIVEFFTIYYVIAIFASVFGYVFVITYAGPAKSTTVLDFEIYQYAFLRNNRGMASALSFLLLIGTSVFIYLEYRLRKGLEARDA
jgi:ABC-type sugar transport system permease subunit